MGLNHLQPLILSDVTRPVNPVEEFSQKVAQADTFLGIGSEGVDNLRGLDLVRRPAGRRRPAWGGDASSVRTLDRVS